MMIQIFPSCIRMKRKMACVPMDGVHWHAVLARNQGSSSVGGQHTSDVLIGNSPMKILVNRKTSVRHHFSFLWMTAMTQVTQDVGVSSPVSRVIGVAPQSVLALLRDQQLQAVSVLQLHR